MAVVISSTVVACKKADLSSDKGKSSYAIGYGYGSFMKKQGVDIADLDMKSFKAAVEDALSGTESSLDQKQTEEAMQGLMATLQKRRMAGAAENQKKGDDFLAANKVKDGVKTTSTGLQYKVIKEGKGAKPKLTDMVTVHYAGKLIDGKEFDSSYKRNEPVKFKLNEVIKGWSEGLQLMTVGSKYELVIPADLGYGPGGNQVIPGNSVLVFEVELMGIGK